MSEDNEQGATPKSERAFDAFAVRNDKDGKGSKQKNILRCGPQIGNRQHNCNTKEC